MSIEAMNWAMWQQRTTDPVARHVLWALANYANEDGKGAFCSVETIECITRLGERTIRRKLAQLQVEGLIRPGNQAVAAAYIDRADRRPQVFDLVMGPVPSRREALQSLRDEKRGAGAAPREDATGCRSVQNGVPLSPERGAGAAPKPSLTHPLPNTPLPPKGAVGGVEESFAKVWNAFPQHRQTKRAKALEAFKAAKPDAAMVDRMLRTIERQKGEDSWKLNNGRFVPTLVKWIEDRRWEDGLPLPTGDADQAVPAAAPVPATSTPPRPAVPASEEAKQAARAAKAAIKANLAAKALGGAAGAAP